MAAAHNNFDFLRIAAALSVLVSHQYALTGLTQPGIEGVHTLGGLAVLVFFSISGFLVAQSWQQDPHVGRFAARRLLRIWPALAVVVVLCAFVVGPLRSSLAPADYFHDSGVFKYLRNLRFMQIEGLPGLRFEGSALPTAVNGSLWTIPMEVKCYMALALIGLAAGRWLRPVAVVATACLALPFLVLGTRGEWFTAALHVTENTRLLLEVGLFFLAGVLLQCFSVHRRSGRTRALVLAGAVGLAAVAFAFDHRLLAAWLLVPLLAVLVGSASTTGLNRAGQAGDLSYGVYLYAFPVQQVLIASLRDRLPWSAVLALTVAATLALAFASWHLVEKRALRLKPRLPRALAGPTPGPAGQPV